MTQDRYTKLARGQPCRVRFPVCDGGEHSGTTVLAHYSLAGLSGGGLKSPSVCGAHCCGPCHDVADGRRHLEGWPKERVRLALAEGCIRTMAWLHKSGELWVD